MNAKKKMIFAIIMIILSTIIVYCGYSIAVPLMQYNKEKNEADNQVKDFLQQIQEAPADGEEEVTSEYSFNGITMGVMTINKIDMTAPIAIGVDEVTLKTHIGVYPEYDPIGTNGGNTVFAAHSAIYGYCAHCFFHRLSEMEPGDVIEITWKNKHTYKYQVYEVLMNEDPDRTDIFERIKGKEVITLVTCTNGNSEVRTFIHAERIE